MSKSRSSIRVLSVSYTHLIADHLPDSVDALAVEGRTGVGLGAPALGGRGEVVQRPVVIGLGGVGADLVIAVGLRCV